MRGLHARNARGTPDLQIILLEQFDGDEAIESRVPVPNTKTPPPPFPEPALDLVLTNLLQFH